jgi:phenylacetate-CoA ligase
MDYMKSIKNSLFKLKINLFRRKAINLLSQIEKESLLDDNSRRDLAFKRFKDVLLHAYENTDFYRHKYDQAAFDPYSLNSINEINKIPLLTKEELRLHGELIKDKKAPKNVFLKSVTGGSSGVPTTVYHDKRNHLEAFNWFLLKNWGANPSDNAAFLERYNPSKSKPFLDFWTWWPTRRVHLDVTNVGNNELNDFYLKCKKIKPAYIEGYVGAVEQFAFYLIENQIKINSVKFVWTTSAPLLPKTRDTIKRAFNCPVYDQYGCCEIYWLGAECSCGDGLHVFDTYRHFEILNDDGSEVSKNNFGMVVVTDLINYAFPLIRYVNGDRGGWSDVCKCNSNNFKKIQPVQGRTSECIKLPSGGFIPGEFLTTIFDEFPSAVAKFQVYQKKDFSVVILYVKGRSAESAIELLNAQRYIKSIIEMKSGLRIEFKEVDIIPHDNGKLRYIISEVNQ